MALYVVYFGKKNKASIPIYGFSGNQILKLKISPFKYFLMTWEPKYLPTNVGRFQVDDAISFCFIFCLLSRHFDKYQERVRGEAGLSRGQQ